MTGLVTITLGDLAIALSAAIGVFGSYALYKRRRRDTADQLRRALFAEMGQMGDQIYGEAIRMKSSELANSPSHPEESPITTTVYDTNAGELGRLTEHEIEATTSFYTKAKLADRRIRRAVAQCERSVITLVYIRALLVELNNLNNSALDSVEANIEEPPVEVDHRSDLEGEKLTAAEICTQLRTDQQEAET